MTGNPGFDSPRGTQRTPIYEDLVHEHGDVLADSRAAAEAARQETSAAMNWPQRSAAPEEPAAAPMAPDDGPGEPEHFD